MSFRRNKKSANNCPVCGVFVCVGYQTNHSRLTDEERNHECDPPSDAAFGRDSDNEPPGGRSFEQRLAEGFGMLREDEDADDDD